MKNSFKKFKNKSNNFIVIQTQKALGNTHLLLKHAIDKVEVAEGNLMQNNGGEDRLDVVRARRTKTIYRQEKYKHDMIMLKRRIRSWTDIPSREVDDIVGDIQNQ
jgi:hypothetical protein